MCPSIDECVRPHQPFVFHFLIWLMCKRSICALQRAVSPAVRLSKYFSSLLSSPHSIPSNTCGSNARARSYDLIGGRIICFQGINIAC